jgi:putative ABC transport system permease protein
LHRTPDNRQLTPIFKALVSFETLNFMNLSTARSASRAKEFGVRKALGAHRSKLVHQFFSETFLLSFVSFAISLGLVEISLPFFRSLTGSELSFDYIIMSWLILGYFGLVSFVAFVAGSYPAFFLSAFQSIKVLTGRLKAGATGSRIRGVLVTSQFTISKGYNLIQTRVMAKISINPDFIPTMGIQIVAGRNFSHEIISD